MQTVTAKLAIELRTNEMRGKKSKTRQREEQKEDGSVTRRNKREGHERGVGKQSTGLK